MNTAAPVTSAKAETLRLPEHRDAFYGGEWHKPKSGKYVDSINPGTGESLGPFADCGAEDIDAAVQAAKKAFDGWRNTPPLERARLLKRIAAVLRENADELAMIDAADCGNPVHEMVMDATIAAAQIEFLRRPGDRDERRLDPDGPRCGELLRARAARRRRPHHSVQPSLHVLRRQGRRAACDRQHRDHEAAGTGAALLAAARRTDRRSVAARRVQHRARRRAKQAPRSPPIRASP